MSGNMSVQSTHWSSRQSPSCRMRKSSALTILIPGRKQGFITIVGEYLRNLAETKKLEVAESQEMTGLLTVTRINSWHSMFALLATGSQDINSKLRETEQAYRFIQFPFSYHRHWTELISAIISFSGPEVHSKIYRTCLIFLIIT
jgi:hypothetical protein